MRFVSHAEDTDFVMTRNEDYQREWSADPGLPTKTSYKDRVHLVRPEPLSRIVGIEAGELDVAKSMAADITTPLVDAPNFAVIWGYAGQGNMHIIPDLHITGIDAQPVLRQTVNHAVNEDAFIDNLLVGTEGYSYGHRAGTVLTLRSARGDRALQVRSGPRQGPARRGGLSGRFLDTMHLLTSPVRVRGRGMSP
jgi:ABC-type transport system substrate-binding protein